MSDGEMVAFWKARLDEDEQWARAASQPYKYADGDPAAPPGGVHWRWGTGPDWTPAEPELGRDIIGEYGENSQLLTVETWPTRSVGEMRRPYADHIVEMDSAAAGHIARHDPARVLREVAAMRRIIAGYEEYSGAQYPDYDGGYVSAMEDAIKAFVAVYSDHPDYRAEWKP